MAVVKVYESPVTRSYYADFPCSKAFFTSLIAWLLVFGLAFITVYFITGFTIQKVERDEQPDVHFKHQYMAKFYTMSGAGYTVASTYPYYNDLEGSRQRTIKVTANEFDKNNDGLYDSLKVTMEVPVLAGENIRGVDVLLMLDYRLEKYSQLRMESMARIKAKSQLPGAKLSVFADLALVQKENLKSGELDTRYNTSVVKMERGRAEDYRMENIVSNYKERNVTTQLMNIADEWTIARVSPSLFTLVATIQYPVETITYAPTFAYQLLLGVFLYAVITAINYVVIILFVLNYIFKYGAVPTVQKLKSQ